ncbi:hypothetical protein Bbelb_103720 [Branchiostoma belcheri]|nr:hypothetical protein Bbelb_103720 [Branchiostoma belcheri]
MSRIAYLARPADLNCVLENPSWAGNGRCDGHRAHYGSGRWAFYGFLVLQWTGVDPKLITANSVRRLAGTCGERSSAVVMSMGPASRFRVSMKVVLFLPLLFLPSAGSHRLAAQISA